MLLFCIADRIDLVIYPTTFVLFYVTLVLSLDESVLYITDSLSTSNINF